ncbi:MAG: BREX-1 system adenine-specific DNA-methyltransferase PglX [Candidatus Cyclonatronum sp.]|uniref:BREX-1 system adenine-specific DNA-methyltransferase PglX n=1 Tax=Cyclonatronum sp. TaxID=3024185 RepID=UPI0025C552BC|nr:BREX-1 system adenine-specific DNA-methyltransferase PglX [Cyclonatronum sp.]MCH8487210.1 BREX-1 system adenine-specific DNA-methyltransferase PglX [Cyclonatronum sp.]
MQTKKIKDFAQQARQLLRDGVKQRLLYWGFRPKGEPETRPDAFEGGYIFRGGTYDGSEVPRLWDKLHTELKRKGFEAVVEEGAYVWFNRMMAMRILAANGYEPDLLGYVSDEQRKPVLLERAKQGIRPELRPEQEKRLQQIILDFELETEAFSILLTAHCRTHPLLQRVFGRQQDYTELLLPDAVLATNGFLQLLNSTDAITEEDYKQVELIGWLYQFYISEKKDEVFKSFKKKKKAGVNELPAATQIFTPRWIVQYMVENTLGQTWLEAHPESPLRSEMKYLVEKADTGGEVQLPEGFTGDPAGFRLLDPASGSGHILVVAFELLMHCYREQYYTTSEAVDLILTQNLYGLDIDPRAAQLSQFALLLKAAAYDPGVLQRRPAMKVFAMPEPRPVSRQDVRQFLGEVPARQQDELHAALQLMQQAQLLGSVMKFELGPQTLQTMRARAEAFEKGEAETDLGAQALWADLRPYLQVLLALTQPYHAVVANPPYMGQRNMDGKLKAYIGKEYPLSKSDLATALMEKMKEISFKDGRFSLITPPSWMFISSYEKLRELLIKDSKFDSLLHLSRGVFGADFGSAAATFQATQPSGNSFGTYFRLVERTFQEFHHWHLEELFSKTLADQSFRFDFQSYDKDMAKISFSEKGVRTFYGDFPQSNFSKIPGSPIAYWVSDRMIEIFETAEPLKEFGVPRQGMATSDNNRFLREWFEVNFQKIGLGFSNAKEAIKSQKKWFPYNKGGGYRKWYGNQDYVVNWENDGYEIKNFKPSVVRNEGYYFMEGITWSDISSGNFACRYTPKGFLFDVKGSSALPGKEILYEVIGFLNSIIVTKILYVLNPTLSYQVGNISSLPFLFNKIFEKDPFGDGVFKYVSYSVQDVIDLTRKDSNSRETSWDFTELPLIALRQSSLGSSIALWKVRSTRQFVQLNANEEELNRIFIDLYGLKDELGPEVAFKDITILQDELDAGELPQAEARYRQAGVPIDDDEITGIVRLPFKEDELMQLLLSYALGCIMGRYRLDKPGLHIAHPDPAPEAHAPYEVTAADGSTHTFAPDQNAIVPLLGSSGRFPDDLIFRVRHFLICVWGEARLTDTLNTLQEKLGTDLEKYLVKDLWPDHCKRYKKRPIYWLFSSPKGAFQVLVYMHRYNRYTIDKIYREYLLPHLRRLEEQISTLSQRESSSTPLSRTETKQLDQLRKDLQECLDYEPLLKEFALDQHEIDLDDGVKVNYEKFEGIVRGVK